MSSPGRRRCLRDLLLAPPLALTLGGCRVPSASGGASRGAAGPRLPDAPFAMGVASGDPSADGFVIGTRLIGAAAAGAPIDPLPIAVAWEVADDPSFARIVAGGRTLALPAFAHAVQVEIEGLRPDRWYWYRFHAGGGDSAATSPVGRSRTTPAVSADASAGAGRWRLAFASCQQYEQGYYGAYRHMLADDVDLVVFLGDYIYESSWGRDHVRHHGSPEPVTLDEYRARHALYRSDPQLQAMHAAAPWVAVWDDHEVQNDYADDQGQDLAAGFVQRRAAGYRAWAETVPQRPMARRMAQAVACAAAAGLGRPGWPGRLGWFRRSGWSGWSVGAGRLGQGGRTALLAGDGGLAALADPSPVGRRAAAEPDAARRSAVPQPSGVPAAG
ncbi:MAG: alkaline phosphatase D family protein [Burkholderiaceae bacterium]